jgi:hypothetical protein
MKRIVVIILSLSLLMLASALGSATNANAQEEVVILICAPRLNVSPPQIRVVASSSSDNAPAITPGTSCAQALSDLIDEGFQIEDETQAAFRAGIIYTLEEIE